MKQFDVIPVENFYVVVDKDNHKGKWLYYRIDKKVQNENNVDTSMYYTYPLYYDVIVATIGKRIEGIPMIEIPDEVEQMALKQYPKVVETGERMRTATDFTQREAWKKGYKAAQSKGTYTEEDINQALFIGARNPTNPKKAAIELEAYKSLQKKKVIKAVVLEMEEYCIGKTGVYIGKRLAKGQDNKFYNEANNSVYQFKTIQTEEGEVIQGRYIYE